MCLRCFSFTCMHLMCFIFHLNQWNIKIFSVCMLNCSYFFHYRFYFGPITYFYRNDLWIMRPIFLVCWREKKKYAKTHAFTVSILFRYFFVGIGSNAMPELLFKMKNCDAYHFKSKWSISIFDISHLFWNVVLLSFIFRRNFKIIFGTSDIS